MPQIRQSTLDPSIPPGGILLGHTDDQLFDLLSDTRPAKVLSLLTAVKLLRDQSFVPAQEGLGRGNGRDFFEAFATKRVGQRRVLYPQPTDNSRVDECGKIVSFSCHEKGTALWPPLHCFTNSY
jgi:hypothetical protein